MMNLKVCGLTNTDQIRELVSMNVDFLGFIFYEKSLRYVLNHLTPAEINSINHSGKVGVFVNEKVEEIAEIAERSGLNFIQLHGDENENFINNLRNILKPEIKIIKVLRIGSQPNNLQVTINHAQSADYFLFDTDSTAFGGTGKTFHWRILNDLEITKPYFLSGGISLENAQEISEIKNQPFALDINSKFEIEPGTKDLEKIKHLYEKL